MSDAPTTDAPQSSEPVGHKVFAGNLAYAVTDDSLRAFFAPVANDIVTAQVITRGSRSAGYGFVTVKSIEAAQKACELLDKKELEGRQVVVEVAKAAEQKDKERTEKRAKRRAGRARGRAPPGEVTEAEASGEVDKPAEAEVAADGEGQPKRKSKKKRVPRKKNQTPADGTAEAESATIPAPTTDAATGDAAAAARKKTPRAPKEKRPPRPAGEDPVGEPSTTVLFVANLGFNVDDAGLSELFTAVGINVISARVVRRRWGKPRRSKGYGFVDVGGEEEQKKAIAALQGKEIEGREIAVKVAVNANHEDDEINGANGASAHAKESSPEATILAQ